MKSISMMTAVALAACLSFGHGEAKAAQDSIATTATASKTPDKVQVRKKGTKKDKKTTPLAERAAVDTAGVIAFSDTSDCAADTVYVGTPSTATTISLIDKDTLDETDNILRQTDNILRHFIRFGTKAAVTVLILFLFLFVLLLLFIYLIYTIRKSLRQTGTTAPQQTVQPQNTRNETFTGSSVRTEYTSPESSGNSPRFRGYLFDEAIMISGIKYTSVGLGIFMASLYTHAARFFVWASIIILFIGLGKMAIAWLPNLKPRETDQPQPAEVPAQEKPTEQETAPSATRQPENPENYMPSAQKENNDTEA